MSEKGCGHSATFGRGPIQRPECASPNLESEGQKGLWKGSIRLSNARSSGRVVED